MKSLPVFFSIIFVAVALSWGGLVLINHETLGKLGPVPEEGLQDGQSTLGQVRYPRRPSGLAEQGARVYAQLGCYRCHTQQVRPDSLGNDIARGWGDRQSVARDYIYDQHLLLGSWRVGPDLSNVGERVEESNDLHVQLFDPRLRAHYSMMPSYDFLYEVRPQGSSRLDVAPLRFPDALPLELAKRLAGKEVVPTEQAQALAAYLQSLKLDYALPEAPIVEAE